jgi:hypothetical protein
MKAKFAIIGTPFFTAAIVAAGVLVLMAGEASATEHSQRRHVREYQTSSPTDLYYSYSQGRQPYPNPDRQLYLPD